MCKYGPNKPNVNKKCIYGNNLSIKDWHEAYHFIILEASKLMDHNAHIYDQKDVENGDKTDEYLDSGGDIQIFEFQHCY